MKCLRHATTSHAHDPTLRATISLDLFTCRNILCDIWKRQVNSHVYNYFLCNQHGDGTEQDQAVNKNNLQMSSTFTLEGEKLKQNR